jgi:Rrf2 family iron-sulfur cluster assembly transcriptional regulator
VQLSTKGRYAVMAMVDLARQSCAQATAPCRAVSLADIAARQEISLAYLEQLFARLRRAGLVTSVRGPGGGYRLTLPPAETRVSAIIHAVDEPMAVTRCGGHVAAGCMTAGAKCLTHDLWEALGDEIDGFLSRVSLEDVVQRRVRARSQIAA